MKDSNSMTRFSTLALLLLILLSVFFAVPARAQTGGCDPVRPDELEPGYGIYWDNYKVPWWLAPTYVIVWFSVSSDGKYLAYVASDGTYLKDLHTNQVVARNAFGGEPQWSPDSKTLMHRGNPLGMEFINVETWQRQVLGPAPDTSIWTTGFLWGPDGNLYFTNSRNNQPPGDSTLWRIFLDSSLKAGHIIWQKASKSRTPTFPRTTVSWYVVVYNYTFDILTNFNSDGKRSFSFQSPDTTRILSDFNSWGLSGYRENTAVTANGDMYVQLSFRAKSGIERHHDPPFSDEDLRARNASGWYRTDTLGRNPVQLVRLWSTSLGISVTADGEKIYYGFLNPDSTMAVYEMDKCGRNKRQVTFPGEPSGVRSREPGPDAGVTLTPNPATDHVRIDTRAGKTGTIRIYDMMGGLALTAATDAEGIAEMDTRGLSAGVYRAVVTGTGKSVQNALFVVVH